MNGIHVYQWDLKNENTFYLFIAAMQTVKVSKQLGFLFNAGLCVGEKSFV